ncbi:Ig-like domain-containing protein [Salipiger sp. 1_MG-2023]|uniref:Ig-like domain-containing protein n=1 Tax=Salipiger sp. 1_MG-2023 TaxID=3062665 RepID=UPI0026E17F48|nr:Ig-like domain-containing protein [Salipiger sp. 1_MG-2023]MDO6585958.1 Ig-like domain-containing protein [Salipiger sp. 1_MG-2023]
MADLVLDWSALGAYGTNLEDTAADAVTTSVDTGGVTVDITFTAQDDEAQAFTATYDGYVPEGLGIDPNSHLKLFGLGGDGGTVSPTSTTVLNFSATDALYSDSVQNVTFVLNDVDGGAGSDLGDLVEYSEGGDTSSSFQDYVTVLAYDAEGNATAVTISPLGTTTSVDGDTATGDAITAFADQDGTLKVSIEGPVSRIEIVYENGGDSTQGVLISDVSFSTIDADDLAPVAEDDVAETLEDTPVVINVLDNDSDPEGGALSVTSATATNGSVTINDDGTLTYTPDENYNGPDEIAYTVTNPEGTSDSASVAVTVTPVNDDPVAVDDTVSTGAGTPVSFDPTDNDTDVDGDPLTGTLGDPDNGTVTDNGDGSFTYTPDDGFTGNDTIAYTVDDGNGGSDDGVITVVVGDDTAPGNTAPIAEDDFYTTDVDTPQTINPLVNDIDGDGDPLTVGSIGTPDNGTLVDNGDGTFTYTPDTGFEGDDTISYTVSDGNGGSDDSVITISVGGDDTGPGGNSAPTAVDDLYATTLYATQTVDPTENDTDPEGDALTVIAVGEADFGTVTLNEDGTVSYTSVSTPDGFTEGSFYDSFTYSISDGNGGESEANISVEVLPCFTPGTLIATPQGERLVETLEVGDRVITRDNGIQEIRWIGNKELTGHQLARKPHLRPVLIQAGSLGRNLPEHDLLVSPNHRVLVANDKTALYFEEREVLAAAKHLTGLEGVDEVETMGVTYIHMMFDNHEVVLSNGAWTESFQPGDMTLGAMDDEQRQEIFELFPELENADGLRAYGAARRSLKKHEAQLLTK